MTWFAIWLLDTFVDAVIFAVLVTFTARAASAIGRWTFESVLMGGLALSFLSGAAVLALVWATPDDRHDVIMQTRAGTVCGKVAYHT
jgi:hypothetical protein